MNKGESVKWWRKWMLLGSHNQLDKQHLTYFGYRKPNLLFHKRNNLSFDILFLSSVFLLTANLGGQGWGSSPEEKRKKNLSTGSPYLLTTCSVAIWTYDSAENRDLQAVLEVATVAVPLGSCDCKLSGWQLAQIYDSSCILWSHDHHLRPPLPAKPMGKLAGSYKL